MRDHKEKFYDIYNEFCSTNKFKKLNKEPFHGITKLDHTIRVAKVSFCITKALKLDYVSATRGSFMHDFFLKSDFIRSKHKYCIVSHPKLALKNAKKYFKVNEIEEDIIYKHMYPLTKGFPKYTESHIVSLVDKSVGLYEVLRYKLKFKMSIFMIFMFNIMR